MSGMSPDDEAKERAYSALNIILKGSRHEISRAVVVRELDALVVHAFELNDFKLVDQISRIIFDLKALDLSSADLPAQIEVIKNRIYELQTY